MLNGLLLTYSDCSGFIVLGKINGE
jgi:hypothetical protein